MMMSHMEYGISNSNKKAYLGNIDGMMRCWYGDGRCWNGSGRGGGGSGRSCGGIVGSGRLIFILISFTWVQTHHVAIVSMYIMYGMYKTDIAVVP